MKVLVREIIALYRAFSGGYAPDLPPLPVQYADFAVWQRNWLQGNELAQQLEYWKRQLDAGSSILELPADRPRPAVQTYSGAGRLQNSALSLHGPAGNRCGFTHCQPPTEGTRRINRVLHQHPSVTHH